MHSVKVLIEKTKNRLSPVFLWTYLDSGSIKRASFEADHTAIIGRQAPVCG